MKRNDKIFIAIILIAAIIVVPYYMNQQSTNIIVNTHSNSPYENIGTVVTVATQLNSSREGLLDDHYVHVTFTDSSGYVVKEFDIKGDGKGKNVTGLKPGIYSINYTFNESYPYKSSTNSSKVNITTSTQLEVLKEKYEIDQAQGADFNDWFWRRGGRFYFM